MVDPTSRTLTPRGSATTEDRERIIAVIEEESSAWIRGDVESWKSCWVQDKHVQHVNACHSIGASILRGFDEISGYMIPHIEAFSARGGPPPKIRCEAWSIAIGSDMAWARFDQFLPLESAPDASPGRHIQFRILEKVTGEWKIAVSFHLPNRAGGYSMPWVQVDRVGKIKQMGSGAEKALQLHGSLQRINQRLCARVALDNKKLRQVLAEADDLIRDRKGCAPMPLVLNHPDSSSISLAWVTVADMVVVVLLGDAGLLNSKISHAGALLGLTPTQLRVAEAIARGMDLTSVAKLLQVRPNTVRTHVRRMFQRLDVNSQPAMIRALLEVEPPHF
jgi:DNA-binding CsgD family transcriptional regulator